MSFSILFFLELRHIRSTTHFPLIAEIGFEIGSHGSNIYKCMLVRTPQKNMAVFENIVLHHSSQVTSLGMNHLFVPLILSASVRQKKKKKKGKSC